MSSFLFQNTTIPIQVTLLGMHHFSHILPQTIISIQLTLLGMHHYSRTQSQRFSKALVLTTTVKVFGMLQHTNPLSLNWSWYWEIFISSSCQNTQFWGPKIDKKVIKSSTKCLISVKIAILNPLITSPLLVNVWLIFHLQKYVKLSTDFVCFWTSFHAFKVHVFCMDLQPAADPYNVVCTYMALTPYFWTDRLVVNAQGQKQDIYINLLQYMYLYEHLYWQCYRWLKWLTFQMAQQIYDSRHQSVKW